MCFMKTFVFGPCHASANPSVLPGDQEVPRYGVANDPRQKHRTERFVQYHRQVSWSESAHRHLFQRTGQSSSSSNPSPYPFMTRIVIVRIAHESTIDFVCVCVCHNALSLFCGDGHFVQHHHIDTETRFSFFFLSLLPPLHSTPINNHRPP